MPFLYNLYLYFYIKNQNTLDLCLTKYYNNKVFCFYNYRDVAQMVARHVRDVDAAGSTPVISTKIAVSTSVETAVFFVFDSKESNR